MATYKVIQDIEAEDKLVGPLSFRQFVYGLIAIFLFYLCFISIAKHAGFFLIILLPPALFCAFFAFPFGGDQPTEIWALAKIKFYFKPRKRIWNQSGVKELVTITVPKHVEVQRTDGLTQTEVKSRLRALADTIDSRGWAIKNVTANTYMRPGMINQSADNERLLNIISMPQPVPDYADDPSNDMLDEQGSPLAQQFTSMIQASTTSHRQQLLNNLADQRKAVAASPAQWFGRQQAGPQATVASPPTPPPAAVQTPADRAADQALSEELKKNLAVQAKSHLHPLKPVEPVAAQPVQQPAAAAPKTPVTPTPDPAILNLAKRNDLNVSTLAREASKARGLDDGQEVVISLH